MKVCYLHLGLHKTASSSFQQTCAANRGVLTEAGLSYPIFRCDEARPPRLNINNHSVPLRSLYDDEPENYHINKRWKVTCVERANHNYRAQLEQALSTDQSLILSGEGLSLLSAASLRKLVTLIEQNQFLVRPLAMVRSPLDYAHSIAQQLVRGGQYLPLVGLGPLRRPRLSQRLTIPDGLKEIQMLQEVFDDRLTLVPFRQACRHPDGPVGYLLQDFCEFQQLSLIAFKQTQESKSNLWVRLQNQLNRKWPLFDKTRRLNPGHVRLESQYSDSGTFRLTKQELDLLSDQLNQSNQVLADWLGDDFVESSPNVSAELRQEEILDLLTDLLHTQAPVQPSARRRA